MNYVRDYRVKKLMTQKELAKAGRISQTTISLIENDHSDPIYLTMMKLSLALDVPIKKLFPDEIAMHELKIHRIRQGWTQKELFQRSGVSTVTISFTENWISEPTKPTKQKLARALKVPVEKLFPSVKRQ